MKTIKNKISKIITTSIIAIFSFVLPVTASTLLKNPLGDIKDVPTIAGTVIKTLLGISGSFALLFFIYGGFLWLTAAGKTDRIDTGRKTLFWATIGLFFVFSSYIIANFIMNAITSA